MKKSAPVVDVSKLPEVLTLKEVSGVYRVSPLTIRRALQNGTFRPLPWLKYPYRWRREDVLAHLNSPIDPKQKTRRHGFAARDRRDRKAVDELEAATR